MWEEELEEEIGTSGTDGSGDGRGGAREDKLNHALHEPFGRLCERVCVEGVERGVLESQDHSRTLWDTSVCCFRPWLSAPEHKRWGGGGG